MKIIKENENKLLGRKELEIHFVHEGVTKSKAEIKSEISKKLKIDEKLLIIKEIKTQFGSRNFNVIVMVYENEKILNSITKNHFIKRNTPEKEEVKK